MPTYTIQVHKTASKELDSLSPQNYSRIKTVIQEVAQTEKPTSHEKCTSLKGQDCYKLRVGDYRVLCKLDKPNLNVLKVERRNTVYRDVDEFLERVG